MTNDVLYVPFTGKLLLESPLLNKGSSFTQQERHDFNLSGLLPCAIENIDEQAERAYQQYLEAESHNARHIYLRNIQDTNETLFYYLLKKHLPEMLPIVYTPVVGAACEKFSGYIVVRVASLFHGPIAIVLTIFCMIFHGTISRSSSLQMANAFWDWVTRA